MTLDQAIEEVKRDSDGAAYLTERGILYVVKTPVMRTAIATILNAVVKGELVAAVKPEGRPEGCRFRLQDEGKPYPRSSCQACGKGILTGLGRACVKDQTNDR